MLPRRFIARFALLFSAFILSACSTLQDAPDSDTFIFLDTEETLYVRFDLAPDLRIELAYPDIADSMKEKRFEQYFTLMRSLLQVYQFPMNVYLLEEYEKPGDGPLLNLHAVRWEQNQYGEIEATLMAKLERYGDLNTLGLFEEEETPRIMSNQDRIDEMYAQVMEAALSQMFFVLMDHFKTEVEKLEVAAPLGEAEEE